MNASTTDEVVRAFPWQPIGQSILSHSVLTGVYLILAVGTKEEVGRILAGYLVAQNLLMILLQLTVPRLSSLGKDLLPSILMLPAAVVLAARGYPLLTIPALLLALLFLWDAFREPSNVDLRLSSVGIGTRTIPYASIRSLQVLAKPEEGALIVIHLKDERRPSLMRRLLRRGAQKVHVCVSNQDVKPFVTEFRRLAQIPGV